MKNLLNQVVRAFCMELMNGRVMRPDIMKRKWDMLCNRYQDKMTTEKIREGIGLLYTFYEYAAAHEIQVADIGSPYSFLIPEPKENDVRYEYRGTTGIILFRKGEQVEHFLLDYSHKFPEQADLDQNLKITLDHIGFQKIFHRNLVCTHVHHLRKNREYHTMRDLKLELPRVKEIIRNVARSIRQNIWYPHETPFCTSCQTRELCSVFGLSIDS